MAKSVSPCRVRQQPPDVRCWTLTGRTALSAHVVSEGDRQVGGESENHVLESLEPGKAADIVEEMSPDEAADILSELEEETKKLALALAESLGRRDDVATLSTRGRAELPGALLAPVVSVYTTVGSDVIINAFIVVVAGGNRVGESEGKGLSHLIPPPAA